MKTASSDSSQAGLKLLASSSPPAPAFQGVESIGIEPPHPAYFVFLFFNLFFNFILSSGVPVQVCCIGKLVSWRFVVQIISSPSIKPSTH